MQTVSDFATEHGLTRTLERALEYHPNSANFVRNTPVNWNRRMKSAAGRYNSQFGIELHPGLVKEGPDAIAATFLHEVAHAMQWSRERVVDHLWSWHRAMYQLDQIPQRLHHYTWLRAYNPLKTDTKPDDMDL